MLRILVSALLLSACIVKKDETHVHPCVVVPPKASAIEFTLINGELADPKDWPTLFKAVQGSASCTGTVIGPRALQLAAHCVGNGKTSTIVKDGVKYVGICTHHSEYKKDATADYALCLLDKEIVLPWYESITSQEVVMGEDLLLTGMGCVKGDGTPSDWKLRVGLAKVVELPLDDNDIVTEGGAALCFGDSAGSAFMKVGEDYKIAGINSRGDIQTTSYLPAVYTDTAKAFYSKWANDNSALICGVSKDAKKCRGDKPVPPPPPPPPPPGPEPKPPVPPGPVPPPAPAPDCKV